MDQTSASNLSTFASADYFERRNVSHKYTVGTLQYLVFNVFNSPLDTSVLGPTGSGKSSFINKATGSELPVSYSLDAGTIDVTIAGIPLVYVDGHAMQLIDTPGFDDPRVGSDLDILQRISAFLSESYRQGERIGGTIYMHRISDNRLSGSAKRNLQIFQRIHGQKALQNTVFLTSMWSSPPAASELKREEELKQHPCVLNNTMAAVARLELNTREETEKILRLFVGKSPEALDIQVQMVEGGKLLHETDAAHAVDPKLVEELRAQEAQIKAATERRETMKLEAEQQERLLQQVLEKMEEKRRSHEAEMIRLGRERPIIQICGGRRGFFR
ncbi:hypothetical protein BDV93DRAFT_594028 [Ceratobasidium sp. AG-I]|nr:hypothetical protein BDV93DRAFT_594028 [Ceratobasidium sp. AG-I]